MSNPRRLWIIRRAWAVKAVRGWAVKLRGGAVKLLEAVRGAL